MVLRVDGALRLRPSPATSFQECLPRETFPEASQISGSTYQEQTDQTSSQRKYPPRNEHLSTATRANRDWEDSPPAYFDVIAGDLQHASIPSNQPKNRDQQSNSHSIKFGQHEEFVQSGEKSAGQPKKDITSLPITVRTHPCFYMIATDWRVHSRCDHV